MAIRKISEFVEASSPQNSDKLLIERNGSGKSITVKSLLSINMDLLWEYANPNNGYSGGVPINLDLSGYKFIYITALTWAGNNSYVDFLFKIDNMVHTMMYFDTYGMKREMTVKTNGRDVGDNEFFSSYGSAGTENNAGLVPYQIYGVK